MLHFKDRQPIKSFSDEMIESFKVRPPYFLTDNKLSTSGCEVLGFASIFLPLLQHHMPNKEKEVTCVMLKLFLCLLDVLQKSCKSSGSS